ncbi:hypothetical protein [Mucilaginibacter sp. CSA2-8R]|uniref:hypothetical protein n=1 Tax=Mucilaginibacter sp. CSA2-8R TaxID=3141542 RepID=UPI00315C4C6C
MEVHIGQEIERQFQNSGLKIGAFAERINTGDRNVYSIFQRKDISAEMLVTISNALNFNFFKLYEQNLPTEFGEAKDNYIKNDKSITISIDVRGTFTSMAELPEFLKDVNEAAAKRGLQIV